MPSAKRLEENRREEAEHTAAATTSPAVGDDASVGNKRR